MLKLEEQVNRYKKTIVKYPSSTLLIAAESNFNITEEDIIMVTSYTKDEIRIYDFTKQEEIVISYKDAENFQVFFYDTKLILSNEI